MINYVLGFAFNKDGSKVVLILKSNPGPLKGLYTGPGGKIEPDELAISAMVREFEEETGVIISYWKNEFKITSPEYTINVYSSFTDDITKVSSITEEAVSIIDVNDLYAHPCTSDTRWIVPYILDNRHSIGSVSVNMNVQ